MGVKNRAVRSQTPKLYSDIQGNVRKEMRGHIK